MPGLTPEQTALASRLEVLARDVQREWLLRGIAKEPPPKELANAPPTREMMDRVADRGWRLRASVVAHAEDIVLQAVLSPEQSGAAKRLCWARGGVFALYDPELSARLRLSAAQREQIAALIQGRPEVFDDVHRTHGGRMAEAADAEASGQISGAQRVELEQQDQKGFQRDMANYDQCAWDFLSPRQLRALNRLLGKAESFGPASKPKRARRST